MQIDHCDFNLDDFNVDLDDFKSVDLDDLQQPNLEDFMERSLEVHQVAHRLSVHPCTVRRMFAAGVLHGFRTGPTKKLIRISERSLEQHISEQEKQHEQDKQGGL